MVQNLGLVNGASGSWTTAPLWSKVDDDLDSPDGTVIVSANNLSTPSNDVYFALTCPSDVDTVTAATLRIRAREQGNSGRSISLFTVWSATSSTDVNTGTMSSTLSNYSSSGSSLSISKATCDSSTLQVRPTTTGSGSAERAEIDGINLDITYSTASSPNVNRLLISRTIPIQSTP
ncbi:MAG: hypothetical protein A3F68_10090 [Acidobacteria bacterium RIFCSPLOWO2_12_FULL_54_10]|nr:MAG: hypothetical protein A3F68_10090 [Acidobacteria bacterium RIFCSPLOWO2_12_FULL_54_10]